nr:flagellar protein FlaG [uncultured Undibacterium sp.]
MDIQPIANRAPSGASSSDRVSGNNFVAQPVKTAAPVQTSNPVTQTDQTQQLASADQVKSAVKSINNVIQVSAPDIQFSVDSDTDKLVVKIVDQQTKQVLRQIPTEEVIEIAKSLDKLQGLLIKQTA